MNIFSRRREEIEIARSLKKHYLKQTPQQTPHCARNHQTQDKDLNVDLGHESMEERKRFLRHRSGHVRVPHLGNTTLATEILNMKKS